MIDAHAAGVAQRGAHRRQERREPAGGQRARREAGQPPVLPTWIEQIGGRANRQTASTSACRLHAWLPFGIHPDGKVADQADAHARGRAHGPAPWRANGRPAIAGSSGTAPPARADAANTATVALAGSRRSVGQRCQSPTPAASLSACSVSNTACCASSSPPSARKLAKSSRERPSTRLDELLEQRPQQTKLGVRGRRPVDQRLRFQPCERLAEPVGAHHRRPRAAAPNTRPPPRAAG